MSSETKYNCYAYDSGYCYRLGRPLTNEEDEFCEDDCSIQFANTVLKNDGWIPVSSGKLPEEKVLVQVTYLGLYDNKPYCDGFARLYNGKWYWTYDDEQVIVKIQHGNQLWNRIEEKK